MRLMSDTPVNALRLPLSQEDRLFWQNHLGDMAILRLLGVELSLQDEHLIQLTLTKRTHAHGGGLGTEALNGAIIAGIMDCAMSIAGILHFRGKTCGTVQLSIQFMKPVRTAHPVVQCYAVRKSASVVFLEARLFDDSKRCSALATGVVGVTRLSKKQSGEDGSQNWLSPVGRMHHENYS